jgi:hypothetical protein
MDQTLRQLKAFSDEAEKLADAFSEIGEDDNSYESSGLAVEANEWIFDLNAKTKTVDEATAWLTKAKTTLNNIR